MQAELALTAACTHKCRRNADKLANIQHTDKEKQ